MREAFKDSNLLPKEVLYRKKEAFSDGVSGLKRSWYVVLQEYADKKYSDDELRIAKTEYKHLPPCSKESLYFRKIFESYYGKMVDKLVRYYWLPLWSGDITEPSARILNVYKKE